MQLPIFVIFYAAVNTGTLKSDAHNVATVDINIHVYMHIKRKVKHCSSVGQMKKKHRYR